MSRLGLTAVLALGLTSIAWAGIEFIGILVTSRETRFAVAETATGATDWVKQGEVFSGYTLRSYDPGGDVLTLVRDNVELRLTLKNDAKVTAARFELTGEIKFGSAEKIEVQRATLLFDQENVFPLKDGATYRITPTRRADNTINYRITIQRLVAANKTETVAAPGVIALPGQPFSIQFSEDLGFSFTPR
jgi:hypothetical protein